MCSFSVRFGRWVYLIHHVCLHLVRHFLLWTRVTWAQVSILRESDVSVIESPTIESPIEPPIHLNSRLI